MKTVSIVQLTHNNLGQVLDCLPTVAVLAARPEVCEWIVLDNASTDGTADELDRMAADYDKLTVIRSQANLGCCGGRNVTWRKAAGDLVLSMDSDVYVDNPSTLPRMMSDLEDREVSVVGEHGGWVKRNWSWTEQAPPGYSGYVPIVAGFCQLFRRELVERWEPFSLTWLYWLEDSDFCLQAGASGWIDRYGVRHSWSMTNGRDEGVRRQAWEQFRKRWRNAGLRVHRRLPVT